MDNKKVFSKKKLVKDYLNFDWKNYIDTYSDLKYIETKEDAWYHWINYGKHENRIINEVNIDKLKEFKEFDWEVYISLYEDLKDIKTKQEAWNHWIDHGKNENRLCENIFLFEDYENFDWETYINNYEDLEYITSKEEAWIHFINYGFNESRKMSDINEIQFDEYKQIIEDENTCEEVDFSLNKIYLKQKYTNCGKHLFGWKASMNYLVEKLKLNGKVFDKKYYFDEWIEKLLVWGNKIYNKKCLENINDNDLQLITFLHCPPFEAYNTNEVNKNLIINDDSLLNKNIIELIKSNNLFYSIKYLYVLSLHHKNYIINNFPQLKNKIVSLYHPINISNYNKSELFNINNFIDNKQFYHIGWWLRNFNSFFNFKLPDGYNKNTLIKQEFKQEFENKFTDIGKDNKIIYELKDNDYKKLFNNSCIFCDLLDCVANNVVLECIKYNTPIIIRRLPSVEEYLGPDYPLFFTDESELEDYKNEEFLIAKITQANNYLQKMDKQFLKLEKFVDKINYDINKLVVNDNKYKLTWLYYLNNENIDIEKYITFFNYQLSSESIKLIIINTIQSKTELLEKYNNDNITIINVDINLNINEVYKIFIENSTTEYLVFKKFNELLNEDYFSYLCINYFDNNSTFDVIIFKNKQSYEFKNNFDLNTDLNTDSNIDLQIHDDNSEVSNESSILSSDLNLNDNYQLNDNEIETSSLNEDIDSEKEVETENTIENSIHLLNFTELQNYNFINNNINILWRKSIHSYVNDLDNNFWINCYNNHLNIFEIN